MNSVEITIVGREIHNVNHETWVESEYAFVPLHTVLIQICIPECYIYTAGTLFPSPALKIWIWGSCDDFGKCILMFLPSLSDLYSSMSLSNELYMHSNARFSRISNCIIFNSPKYLIGRYAFASKTSKMQFSHLVIFYVSSKLNPRATKKGLGSELSQYARVFSPVAIEDMMS